MHLGFNKNCIVYFIAFYYKDSHKFRSTKDLISSLQDMRRGGNNIVESLSSEQNTVIWENTDGLYPINVWFYLFIFSLTKAGLSNHQHNLYS